MTTPWLEIPLADYEAHMALPSVGQATMLGAELAALLTEFAPATLAVVGCAGGNGFEHIRPDVTSRVVAVDINPHYLKALRDRFSRELPGLEPCVRDIQAGLGGIEPVDLVYAALVFEYVDLPLALRSLRTLCRPGGVLATVVQLPTEALAVISPSPYASLQALGKQMRLVSPATLAACATTCGFELQASRQLALPSGKCFAVQWFR